jgi:hypothetical protein
VLIATNIRTTGSKEQSEDRQSFLHASTLPTSNFSGELRVDGTPSELVVAR